MSYLLPYRPYLYFMLTLGFCPFTVCSTTKKAHLNRLALAYSIILLFINLSTTVILFIWRIQTTYETLFQIRKMANFIQGLLCAVLHFLLTLSCLANWRQHCTLLNDLVDMETKIQSLLLPSYIEDPRFITKTIGKHILFVGSYCALNGYIDALVNELKPLWHNVVWIRTSNIMIGLTCLVLMHIRFVALMLSRCYASICGQLMMADSRQTGSLLAVLQRLARLQTSFQQCFGFFIMLNCIFDLVMLTVTMFMTLLFAESILLTTLMFGLPIAKQAMFIWVVDDFGKQVYLRIIEFFFTHTNLLQAEVLRQIVVKKNKRKRSMKFQKMV